MKKNLLLLLLALIFGLVIAETTCRIKGIYLSYNERTGAGGYTSPFEAAYSGWTHRYRPYEERLLKRDEFTDSWTANEDGLKEKNISEKKEGKRILVLGDSFTEGVGAPPDSSYPRILESLFRLSGDSSLQVINGGIGGSDVFFEYQLLKNLLPKYKPDLVLVTCNSTDINEYLTRGGFERFLSDGSVKYRNPPWFEPLYAHSLLVRLVAHDFFNYDYSFIRKNDYDEEIRNAEKNMSLVIDSFQSLCNSNNIPFAVVFHPFYTEIQHPDLYALKFLIANCLEKNVPYTDELTYLTSHGINPDNWKNIYWPDDGHFKSKGYELLAICTYEFLAEQDWLQANSDSINAKH